MTVMIARCRTVPRIVGAISLAVLSAGVSMSAQTAKAPARKAGAAKAFVAPRTADGQPDLNGIWSYATITPLERPGALAGKQVFSDEEAADFEKKELESRDKDRRDGQAIPEGQSSDVERAYNQFWWDFGTKIVGTKRTSLIVDPPDGRIPQLTPDAQRRQAALAEARRLHPADGPEDRPLGERCILWVNRSGPPMTPSAYNNNFHMVQSKDAVVILNEQAHDARVVPLDGRPHLNKNLQQWRGDSRGHFDGDTLVVETTNFTNQTSFMGSSEHMTLTERFTRVASDVLLYEFTVNDPTSYVRPWTAQIPMTKPDGQMYEYACHEGNYGMYGILAGARAQEKAAAAKKGSN